MPIPLFPLVVASLVAAAYHQNSKKAGPEKGVLTPERQLVFETAINELKEPDKLRKLAVIFKEQGLPGQADLLEKRAKLRELPHETKVARRDIFRKAMGSQDPVAVRKLADVFEHQGATGAAGELRKYAISLTAVPAVNVTAPIPKPPSQETHIDSKEEVHGNP